MHSTPPSRNGKGHNARHADPAGPTPLEQVLSALAAADCFPRPGKDGGYTARCPAHADRRPSLTVGVGQDGRALVNCKTGCTCKAICAALSLTEADLFPAAGQRPLSPTRPRSTARPFPTPQAAIASLERQLGPCSRHWTYTDAAGKPVGLVCRWDAANGRKDIRPVTRHADGWHLGGMPAPRPLYQLPDLIGAETVYILEGEKCADLACALGLVGTTSPHGAQSADKADWSPLAGKAVVILPDNDAAGRQYAAAVATILGKLTPTPTVKIVSLPGLQEGEDLEQWLDAQGDAADLRRQLEALVDAAAAAREEAPAAKPTAGFTWAPISSAEFFSTDYRPEWLVANLVPARQPLIIGGPQKSLKTSTAIDIAISLASGTPALGYFGVPQRRKVAVISGESGPFALQSIGRRVCAAKGIDPATLADRLTWQFRLPQLAVPEQLEALAEGLRRDRPDVVIVEPLYLSLLAGSDARAENLFDVGPLLMRVANACADAGVTPILAHHTGKPAARSLEPLELNDLAYSGVAEFARAWLLLNRREKHEPGTGQHKLWLVAGGSVGHVGLFAVDVAEGQMEEDFGGRHWQVSVTTGAEVRRSEKEERERVKRQVEAEKIAAEDTQIFTALDRLAREFGGIAPYTQTRDEAGMDTARMPRFLARNKHLIEECKVVVEAGNGAKMKVRGWRRRDD